MATVSFYMLMQSYQL